MSLFMDDDGKGVDYPIPVEIVLDRTAFFDSELLRFDTLARLMQFQKLGLWGFSFLKFEEADTRKQEVLANLRFGFVNVYDDLVPESHQSFLVRIWSESYQTVVYSPLLKARRPDIVLRYKSPSTLQHLLSVMDSFVASGAPFTSPNYNRFLND